MVIPSASGGNTSDDLWVAGGVDPGALGTTHGIRMIRAGSVVGVSGNINVTGFVASGTTIVRIFINASNALQTSISVTGAGRAGNQSTQARGAFTFNAGDILNVRVINVTPGDYVTENPIATAEIQYDT